MEKIKNLLKDYFRINKIYDENHEKQESYQKEGILKELMNNLIK
jgi:hypothetical protein